MATLNDVQTLSNKTLTDAKLLFNRLMTNTNKYINFLDISDNIVYENASQTLTNKTLTNPKLSNNIIISQSNNNITIPDVFDTLVNLSTIQTLTNKSLTTPKLTSNIIKSSTDNNISIPDSIDTLVNLNSTQTLTNKTLTNCSANTQLSSDNSTKIATTEFVKFFSAPTKYSGAKLNTETFTFNNLVFGIYSGSLTIATTSTTNINLIYSTELIYNIDAGQQYGRAGDITLNNTSGAFVISFNQFNVLQAGRTSTGHIYNITNNQLYRFMSMNLKTISNLFYFVEQLI